MLVDSLDCVTWLLHKPMMPPCVMLSSLVCILSACISVWALPVHLAVVIIWKLCVCVGSWGMRWKPLPPCRHRRTGNVMTKSFLVCVCMPVCAGMALFALCVCEPTFVSVCIRIVYFVFVPSFCRTLWRQLPKSQGRKAGSFLPTRLKDHGIGNLLCGTFKAYYWCNWACRGCDLCFWLRCGWYWSFVVDATAIVLTCDWCSSVVVSWLSCCFSCWTLFGLKAIGCFLLYKDNNNML